MAAKKAARKTKKKTAKKAGKRGATKKKAAKKAGKKKAAKKKAAKKASKKKATKKAAKKKATPKKAARRPSKKAAKKKSAAKKSQRKAAAKKTSKKRTAAKKPAAKKPAAKKPAAKKPAAKKPAAKKPAAKKPASSKQAARLGEGSQAPSFSLPDDRGETVDSQSLAGAPYVIYFYPRDDTPGCTKEACGFRDDLAEFNQAGVRILGVSPDKVETHGKFREKYGLNFPLLADTEKTLAEAYGAWVLKKNYGREYMGIERSTFLVDSTGTVRKAWRGVKVPGHVEKVLAASREL